MKGRNLSFSGSVLLTMAYTGSEYHGFVVQDNGRTVGGELLSALRILDPHVSALRCVSRTDAGVHAKGQLVAFDTTRTISPRGWVLGLARHLPDAIAPRVAVLVPVGFDPRGHAKRKWYRYTLLRDCRRDPFFDAISWRKWGPLDLDLARTEARSLVGTHDFGAFRSVADGRSSTVRILEEVAIRSSDQDARLVYVDVCGNGFLHNMVRIIVGTLVGVARGKLALGTVNRAFNSLDRRDLGETAPARGLCLERVELRQDLSACPTWPDPGQWTMMGAQQL